MSLRNKSCNKINWYFSVITPALKLKDNPYYRTTEKEIFVKTPEGEVLLSDKKVGDPIINFKDGIEIDNSVLPNVKERINTTVGRVIVNYLLLAEPFKDKIDYINKMFSSKDVEKIISDYLFREIISISEYERFVNNCSFIQPLSKIVVIAATVKNTTKPVGIDKFKKETIEKFNKEYGDGWVKDPVLSGYFSEELKKFDAEYLKDDPTNGKLLSNKIKGNARVKMYLTIGAEKDFNGRTPVIENSLIDGFPKNNEELAYIFNGGRLGSFDRGHETQKGGAVAKDLLRAAGGIKVVEGDCGSKVLKEFTIDKDNVNAIRGMYCHLGDGKLFPMMKPEDFIGKKVWHRTPLFCNLEGKRFCSICSGKILSARPDGINLLFTTVSTPILISSLKGMHNSQIVTVPVSLVENVK